jgi:RNA polymerase sigma-70 factor (ECF subfamily)
VSVVCALLCAVTTSGTAMTTFELEPRLAAHRGELTGYCYRMLGSAFDAEDAVQDTMVRAWKGIDGFEGRSGLRSWLYRIATNVCLTMIESRGKRARPMDLSATAWEPVEASLARRRPEDTWLEPMVDDRVLPQGGDPADIAVARESIRLAFVAALQHLPPRQRAVLILRDVLRWRAEEVAKLLETTTASVNSALQRARATLAERPDVDRAQPFEAYDIDAFVDLLAAEVTQNMPPFELWLEGADDIAAWMLGPGHQCRGSRLVPVTLNGSAAYVHYKPIGAHGELVPFAIQALELADGKIVRITSFLDTRLFDLFGFPRTPPA